LLEIKLPIWRRIQVPNCTLGILHEIIQVAMGWENCHLHQFIIDDVRYGVPEPGLKLKNEDEVLLSQIVPKSYREFRFRYVNWSVADQDVHRQARQGNVEIAKVVQMKLEEWEATINQIVDDISRQTTRSHKHQRLMAWRAKLEKGLTSLRPFDRIAFQPHYAEVRK
jgi:hypothetical protein